MLTVVALAGALLAALVVVQRPERPPRGDGREAPPPPLAEPCYASTWEDPREGTPADVVGYGASYDCSQGRWTFTARTAEGGGAPPAYTYSVLLDADRDPATGCAGFERAMVADVGAAGREAAVVRAPGCDRRAWTPVGAATLNHSGDVVALSVANADLGSPRSLAWFAETSSPAGGADRMPDDTAHEESGFAGGGCHAALFDADGAPGAVDGSRGATVASLAREPDDPGYGRQWALHAVNAAAAWELTVGSPRVSVAVVDTGVDRGHPDLAGKLLPGFDVTTGTALADGNSDPTGHGTAVAGVVGAATGNGVRLASLGWDTSVLPVRNGGPAAARGATARAIRYAADHGARVVNVSGGYPCPDAEEARAVAYALSRGVLVVAAAGNDARRGNRIVYPAAYPGVVGVGATGHDGARAPYSNVGPHVDLVAPGGTGDGDPNHDVTVLTPGGGTAFRSGTSYAAPLVAAAAALLLAVAPDLAPERLVEVLTGSASDIGAPGPDPEHGGGMLDAARALSEVLGRPTR